jgi:hypothetical protein
MGLHAFPSPQQNIMALYNNLFCHCSILFLTSIRGEGIKGYFRGMIRGRCVVGFRIFIFVAMIRIVVWFHHCCPPFAIVKYEMGTNEQRLYLPLK